MKTILALATLVTSVANAEVITGTVKKFSGRYVESGRPYAYSAIDTERGRILLPDWVKADELAALKGNKVTFDARIEGMGCADVSPACPSGIVEDIKSAKIEFAPVKNSETFNGPVKRFKGRAVETPRAYNYIAIDAGERIAVPLFLDAEALLKAEAELTVTGKAKHMMCTDMSAACGPTKVSPLESVEISL